MVIKLFEFVKHCDGRLVALSGPPSPRSMGLQRARQGIACLPKLERKRERRRVEVIRTTIIENKTVYVPDLNVKSHIY